ncbi:MAG: TolC family protein [Fimbriimonadaceae bacterium]|nr:TolC family protein [Fimbriimonadaceae bacterium]
MNFGLAFLATLAGGAFAVQAPPNRLTIDAAVQIAQKNSFAVRIAETNVEKTRQQRNEQRGGLFPTLNASGTYTRFDKASTANFGGANVVIRPIDAKAADLVLAWPIDIFGARRAGIAAIDALMRANMDLVVAEANSLRANVRTAFLNTLKAQELVKVRQDALGLRRATLDLAKVNLEAGAVAKVDVIQAETQLEQAKGDALLADNQLRLAKKVLNNAMGRAIETEFEAVPIEGMPSPPAAERVKFEDAAFRTRRELMSFDRQLVAYERSLKAARGGLLPSLNLSVNHSITFGSGGFGSQSESTTGVAVLRVPLFDGGVTNALVAEFRQDYERTVLLRDQTRLGISLEVQQALVNLSDSQARLAVAEQNVRLAQEALRVVNVRYKAGEAIQIEVDRAQTDLTVAQTSVITAKFDYLAAYAQLQKAVGADDLDRALQPEAPKAPQ